MMTAREPKCVLVVDDDADIREALQAILESYGYRVKTAEGGVRALAELRAGEEPCLILLDLMMPEMTGVQFRAEQLQDPELAKIPVVIISAGGDAVRKAAEMGLEGMTKPIDVDALLEKVKRHGCESGPAC